MAKVRIDFYVNKNDMLHGKAENCEECPVSRSIGRKLKVRYRPQVLGNNFSIFDIFFKNTPLFGIKLPIKVRKFIDSFDCNVGICGSHTSRKLYKPFKFSVYLKSEDKEKYFA